MDKEKERLIIDYILSCEENLILTSQIVTVFDKVLESLVKNFLFDLEKELKMHLSSEWDIIDNLSDDVFGRSDFYITKKSWNNLFMIGFMPDRKGLKDFNFYTYREGEVIKAPIKDGQLFEVLNEKYKKGNSYHWNDWWQYIDDEYRNWTQQETLVKLYHKTDMVGYFIDQFMKIKRIIEPIIDQEIIKYKEIL